MGLKDLASAEKKDLPKKGLRNLAELARVNDKNLEEKKAFFFQVENNFNKFLESINIKKAGFLIKNSEANYVCSFPTNIEVSSFKRLIIPYSKLQESFKESKSWIVFKDNELSLFRSFFSSQEYISITEILLFSLKDDEEFLMLIRSQSDSNNSASFDFEKANIQLKEFIPKYVKNQHIFHSVKLIGQNNAIRFNKIESALSKGYTSNIYRISLKAFFPDDAELETNLASLRFYLSVINSIISALGSKNIAVLNSALYLCIFSKQNLAMDLYIEEIKKILAAIYGNELCESLIAETVSHSKNKEEVLSFLNIKENDKKPKNTFSV